MSRTRHILTALAAGLPILIAALVVNAAWGSARPFAMAALWLVTVVVVEAVLWFRQGRQFLAVANTLGVPPQDMPRALRELTERVESCQLESQRLSGRLEDLSSSLGDGLLVVTADLHVRLINRHRTDTKKVFGCNP